MNAVSPGTRLPLVLVGFCFGVVIPLVILTFVVIPLLGPGLSTSHATWIATGVVCHVLGFVAVGAPVIASLLEEDEPEERPRLPDPPPHPLQKPRPPVRPEAHRSRPPVPPPPFAREAEGPRRRPERRPRDARGPSSPRDREAREPWPPTSRGERGSGRGSGPHRPEPAPVRHRPEPAAPAVPPDDPPSAPPEPPRDVAAHHAPEPPPAPRPAVDDTLLVSLWQEQLDRQPSGDAWLRDALEKRGIRAQVSTVSNEGLDQAMLRVEHEGRTWFLPGFQARLMHLEGFYVASPGTKRNDWVTSIVRIAVEQGGLRTTGEAA